MEVKLVYFRADGQLRQIYLDIGVTPVGRRDDCRLQIPAETVSRRHCQFEINSNEVLLTDLGSSNGTFVNGKRIVDDDVVLQPGDRIAIGPAIFTVQINGEPAEIQPVSGQPQAAAEVGDSALADEDTFDPFGALEEMIDDLEQEQKGAGSS